MKGKAAFELSFQRAPRVRGRKPRSAFAECAQWTLQAAQQVSSRGAGWQGTAQEDTRGGGQASVRGVSSVVVPSFLAACAWFRRLAASLPDSWDGGRLQPGQAMEQQPRHSKQRFCFFLGWKMVRMASSKTALRPFWVRAEHSR